MAGDWIKMRINLDSDPRILAMADELSLPELHIIGCCWKVWAWADSHTLDGNAIRVTDVTLDRFTSVTGFAAALRKVGWLEGRDNALSFPRFAEHNGQTAKKRGETAVRVAKHRNANRVTDVTRKVLPEKRREEKNIDTPPTPKSPKDEQTRQVIEAWNAAGGNIKCRDLTEKRRKVLLARLKSGAWDWQEALAKFPLKLCESDPDGWKPDLDWFLREDSVNRILEGKYDWAKGGDRPAEPTIQALYGNPPPRRDA